jgi:hypothetical protein
MVGRKSSPRPHMATPVPAGTPPERRVKRFPRWLDNDHLLEEGSFRPSAEVWRRHLALQTVGRVRDGRGVGRGCPALLSHVV